jgi:hypothetical protein
MWTMTGSDKPLVLSDESTGGPFVVGAAVWFPRSNVPAAVNSLRKIKFSRGVAPEAKIHCRELFAGSARLKSPFKNLSVTDCNGLLAECVHAMSVLGARWTGCYVNAEAYPSQLRLLEGSTFDVSKKHLAGLVLMGTLMEMDRIADPDYQLAFDPDSTQVDWGLAQRMQATHFTRIDPRSVKLSEDQARLLDMADVGAYTLVQSLLCSAEPETRKHWHQPFPILLKKMGMHTAEFSYRPNG